MVKRFALERRFRWREPKWSRRKIHSRVLENPLKAVKQFCRRSKSKNSTGRAAYFLRANNTAGKLNFLASGAHFRGVLAVVKRSITFDVLIRVARIRDEISRRNHFRKDAAENS